MTQLMCFDLSEILIYTALLSNTTLYYYVNIQYINHGVSKTFILHSFTQ